MIYVPANLLANVIFNKMKETRLHKNLLKDAKMIFVFRFRSFFISEIIEICLSYGTLFPSSKSSGSVNRWLSKWFLRDPDKSEEPIVVQSSQTNPDEQESARNANGKRPASTSSNEPKRKRKKPTIVDFGPQSFRTKTRITLESSIISNLPLLISILAFLIFKQRVTVSDSVKYFEQFFGASSKLLGLLKSEVTQVKLSFKLPGESKEIDLSSLLQILSCGNYFSSIASEKDTKVFDGFLRSCEEEFEVAHHQIRTQLESKNIKPEKDGIEGIDEHFVNFFLDILKFHHTPDINKLLVEEGKETTKKESLVYALNVSKYFTEKFDIEKGTTDSAIAVLEECNKEYYSKFLLVQTILNQTRNIFGASNDSIDLSQAINIKKIVTKKTLANYTKLSDNCKSNLSDILIDAYGKRNKGFDLGKKFAEKIDCNVANDRDYKGISFEVDAENIYARDDESSSPRDDDSVESKEATVDPREVIVVDHIDGITTPFYVAICKLKDSFNSFAKFLEFVIEHQFEFSLNKILHVHLFRRSRDVSVWKDDGDVILLADLDAGEIQPDQFQSNVFCLNKLRRKFLHLLKIGNCLLNNRTNSSMFKDTPSANIFFLLHNFSSYMHLYIRHLERHLIDWSFSDIEHDAYELNPMCRGPMRRGGYGSDKLLLGIKNDPKVFFDRFCGLKHLSLFSNYASIYGEKFETDKITLPFFVFKHFIHGCKVLCNHFNSISELFHQHKDWFDFDDENANTSIVNLALENINWLVKVFRTMENGIMSETHPRIIKGVQSSLGIYDETSVDIGKSTMISLVGYEESDFNIDFPTNGLFHLVADTSLDFSLSSLPSK